MPANNLTLTIYYRPEVTEEEATPTPAPTTAPTSTPTPAPSGTTAPTPAESPSPTPVPTAYVPEGFVIEDATIEVTEAIVEEVRTRRARSMYTIMDDDIPLAGMNSRNLGDAVE